MVLSVVERPVPLFTGNEVDQLESWLDFYRATLLNKCAGLGHDQLSRRTVPPSTMSLLGLLRHMTYVEQFWYQTVFAGLVVEPFYKVRGGDSDPSADFNNVDDTTLEEVERRYLATCEESRARTKSRDLHDIAPVRWRENEVNLRWIDLHVIEEYARHCGHADLLRECTDGATGY